MTTEDFKYTTIRWYNDVDGAKIACVSGSYEDIPFGTASTREFHAEGKPPHPEYGYFQDGLSCSPRSRTIVIDVDHPDRWKEGNVFVELGDLWDVASSVRTDAAKVHIVVTVPEELVHLWPKQGPTVWGDVKSNGFSYLTGKHFTGADYVETGPAVEANAELLVSLSDDRIFPQGRSGSGGGSSAGEWENDDYRIQSHDECVATVMSMIRHGLDDDQIIERLDVVMPNRDGVWAGREAYIREKIRSGYRKAEQWDRQEQGAWALGGQSYEDLAAAVRKRSEEKIAAAQPEVIVQDAEKINEEAAVGGYDLTRVPARQRLNPNGVPVEPRSVSDRGLGKEIWEVAWPNYRIASDEGGWLINTGTHWARWSNKADALLYGSVLTGAYGEHLKTDSELTEELSAKGLASTPDEIEADDRRKDVLKSVRKKLTGTGGQGSIGKQLVTLAHGDSKYSVNISELDAEPDVLWAGGQPWSLLSPDRLTLATDVRPVNQVHLKTAACAPCPGPTPAFDMILNAVWPDPEVRDWALREIAGVMLWGLTSKLHCVLDGPPQGGKSTFALILKIVLGSYAVQVSPDKILGAESSSSVEEEIAAMMGARMVWMDEPPPGGKQAISRFNDLASGTGDLSAARKYANRVSAPKLFNFLICQNPRNALRMDAQGVSERITLIPCAGTPESTNAARVNWLANGDREYPAILARLIRECALFRTDQRLSMPLAARMGRTSAQERSDEFGAWMLENYDMQPEGITSTDSRLANSPTLGSLRTSYNDNHARANGLSKIGAAEARDQLDRLGIKLATAGPTSSRRKDVVFVQAKATSMLAGGRF